MNLNAHTSEARITKSGNKYVLHLMPQYLEIPRYNIQNQELYQKPQILQYCRYYDKFTDIALFSPKDAYDVSKVCKNRSILTVIKKVYGNFFPELRHAILLQNYLLYFTKISLLTMQCITVFSCNITESLLFNYCTALRITRSHFTVDQDIMSLLHLSFILPTSKL